MYGADSAKNKIVKQEEVQISEDDGSIVKAEISTVFLGINMNFAEKDGEPILWETMVFGSVKYDGLIQRWHTRKEAINGHESIKNHISKT